MIRALPFQTADIMGRVRRVTRYYGDGSFDCPHCWYAVNASRKETRCVNPWCPASIHATEASIPAILAAEAKEAAEQREREYRAEVAAWSRQYRAERQAEEAQKIAEVRESGRCVTCFVGAYGKLVKHRGTCPRERRAS